MHKFCKDVVNISELMNNTIWFTCSENIPGFLKNGSECAKADKQDGIGN